MNEGSERKVVVFKLQDEDYGVDVAQVTSIERIIQITRVANVPDFVRGVINLRGIITPVIDLRKRFGLSDAIDDDATRIIIVQVDDVQVGLIVDAVRDVMDIPVDAVEEPPSGLGEVDARYIAGVAKLDDHLLVLLHLDQVLLPEEIDEVAKIEG